MKKAWIICGIAAFLLTACAQQKAEPQAEPLNAAAPEITAPAAENGDTPSEGQYWTDDMLPVSAKAEQPAYRPDTTEIRAVITNRTDEEYSFPADEFYLYRMQSGQETEVPFAPERDYFNAMAQLVMPHETAVFTADLAAHFDLPLEEGVYSLHIGELTTGFEIRADAPLAPETEQTDPVTLHAEPDAYPAGTEQITLLLTNTGSEPADIVFNDFGLEHFLGEAVSFAPFSREPLAHVADIRGVRLDPDDTYTWNLNLSDFGDAAPESGEYAIVYKGQEARFTIG